ncbi:hypothetical protein [Variovorax paradoxus]|uniref:hypothetical protein n=1 Tax=Variovorax paradoxus TaxID=34073 RepID=UPI000A749699|nr:hypothetical protein [Variovorax paradoxus]
MISQRLGSCENCWFNPLQNGSVGLTIGFCVEHRVVLRDSSTTTCGKHFRKDLPLPTSEKFARSHRARYPDTTVVLDLETGKKAEDHVQTSTETKLLSTDPVGDLAKDYGYQDTKIASLAVLRKGVDPRMEFAGLNLSRSYVYRCKARGGGWTSGLNIFWWIKKSLASTPQFVASDFRYAAASSLDRQEDLAKWSLIMARLLVVSDIARHAEGALRDLEQIAQEAASASDNLVSRKLLAWIRSIGIPKMEKAMPEARYRELMQPLLEQPGDI